jgi:membrane protease YdiL (CAAX protease family)
MRFINTVTKINPAFFIPYAGVFIGLNLIGNGWAAILLYHAGIVATLIIRKARFRFSLLYPKRVPVTLLSCVPFACTGLFIWLLWPYAVIHGVHLPAILKGFGLEGGALMAFLIYYVTFNPVLEELFWRGIEDDSKARYTNDLFYAGYHAIILYHVVQPGYVIGAVVVLTLAGIFWRYMTMRHQNHFFAIVTHAVADLSIGIVALVLP